MSPDELVALNEQIAGMAKAGLPLDQGLAGLAKDMSHGRLRRVTAALANDLRGGATLAEAVEKHSADLPPFYASLVTAGVRTGRLPEVLATLSTYARSIAATRAIVYESLFYPAIVMLVALGLFAVLIFVVTPQFDQIFTGFNMRLPVVTQAILSISRHPWPAAIAVCAVVAIGLLIWGGLKLTPHGRRLGARLVYAVPVVGTLIRSARLAAFSELLAMLVEYELPLPEAFRLAGWASSDPLMAERAGVIHLRLNQGMPLAMALRGLGLLPEWVAWMAGAGEQRGTLSASLRQIASLYRRQVESRSALLRSVLPAFMIVLTATVLIAVFVIAVMLPMLKLLEALMK